MIRAAHDAAEGEVAVDLSRIGPPGGGPITELAEGVTREMVVDCQVMAVVAQLNHLGVNPHAEADGKVVKCEKKWEYKDLD